MIELVTGPVGSGKSVLLNKRMVEKAMLGRRLIVNYEWQEEPLYYCLRRRGMRSSTADDVLKTTQTLRTYEQLRGLREAWVGGDEFHLWFNSKMWSKVDLEDVQFWTQHRKAKVDFTVVTQVKSSIDSVVTDLVQIHWEAQGLVTREARVFPFPIVMAAHGMFQSSEEAKLLTLSRYIRVQDFMGGTGAARKSIVGQVGNTSIIGLRRDEARVYSTGKFFSSPLIVEMGLKRKIEYFQRVLSGEVIQLMACGQCKGSGAAFESVEIANAELRKVLLRSEEITDRNFLVRCPCPVCAGKGYFTDPQPSDLAEAHQWAAKGLLGPEYLPDVSGAVTPPTGKRRGGGRASRQSWPN